MKQSSSSLSSFKASEHQAAGHYGCMTSDSLFIKPATRQELDFYTETLRRDATKEGILSEEDSEGIALGSLISHWMSTFLGSLQEGELSNKPISEQDSLTSTSTSKTGTQTQHDKEYIVLQNLYHGFKSPSILDIKLGSKLTDDSVTSVEKIKRLQNVSETTTSGTHSFRICGMKVYNGNSDNKPNELFPGMDETITTVDAGTNDDSSSQGHYLVYDKIFGRSLNSTTIQRGLELYFHSIASNNKQQFLCLVSNFIHRLQLLYNCLLDYETRSYSASLLFIYESDPQAWENVSVDNYDLRDPLIKEFEVSDNDDEEEEEEEEDDDDDDDNKDGWTSNDSVAIEKQALHNVATAYNIVKQSQSNDVEKDPRSVPRSVPLSSLHLIDFAHSKYVDGEGYDENVIEGVENLIKLFEDIKSSYT
ncbi:hypothetical protein KGF57_005334 [Candida theae]|uniref:Kinase n=1 Tax=Candida theae TaxID=1198502 RepID=A0AAD5B920_9ASCO|nr:uncharacterized protein KGF57_005334 [Candida theae]KAI5948723.1 hypothetical protein KGF57_005334 [Candida theae]